jgi:hypothetical protein
VSLRSSAGFHGACGSSSSGSATASMARRGSPGCSSWAATRGAVAPGLLPCLLRSPSLSYFFTPPIFGVGDGFGLGSSSPRGRQRNRDACWGLESYRWPARVWRSRDGRRGSSASVPAATRHASGGASTVGAAAMGAAPCPTACVTPVTGWKTGRKRRDGERADPWTPLGSETRRWV